MPVASRLNADPETEQTDVVSETNAGAKPLELVI
jgi:hypothetical protein